jgi:hypothetical protein
VADAKSSAETMLGWRERSGNSSEAVREGHIKERQSAAHADLLCLEYARGKGKETIAWSLFLRAFWDDDGRVERFRLLFSNCLVVIDGEHLESTHRAHEEGQLKAVAEHSEREIELLRGENADLTPGNKKSIIRRITVEPSFEEAVSALKGE